MLTTQEDHDGEVDYILIDQANKTNASPLFVETLKLTLENYRLRKQSSYEEIIRLRNEVARLEELLKPKKNSKLLITLRAWLNAPADTLEQSKAWGEYQDCLKNDIELNDKEEII